MPNEEKRSPLEETIKALQRVKSRVEELEEGLARATAIIEKQATELAQVQEFISRAFRGGTPRFYEFLAELDAQVAREESATGGASDAEETTDETGSDESEDDGSEDKAN